MRKPLVIGAALTGLLATVLFVLFQTMADDGDVVVPQAPATPEPAVVEAPAAEEAPASARETVAAAPAEALPESPIPAAYRKHLGGVIGRLVEPDGRPVPGKRIDMLTITLEELFPQLDSMFADAPIDFAEVKATTKSKEDGTFRFADMEPRGFYVLGIDPSGNRATIRFVDKAPNSGEVVDLGDVVLDPFVVFTGRVVDSKRSPIAGARVRASNLPALIFQFGVQDLKPGFSVAFQQDFGGDTDWRVVQPPGWAFRLLDKFPLPQTTTGEDGTFRLEGVPTGLVSVLVDQKEFVSKVHGPVPTGDSGEKHIGDVTLDSGETLIGTVVDGSDQPIADAEIIAGPIQDLAPIALVVPVAKTDANGRFEAKGLRDVDHAVAARTRTGIEWTLVRDITPGYDEPKIVLAGTFQVEVRAFAGSGEAVAKPQLVVQKRMELPLHPLLVPPLPLAGRLSYTDDGAAIVTDLAKGKYSILVRAPGYAATQVDADLSEGSTSVAAQLEKEFTTEIRVVAKGDGSPVWWATVGMFSDSRESEERDTQAIPLVNQRSDESGLVKVRGLKQGKYKVVVLHPAYAETFADLTIPGDPLVVELPAGGSIAGRVHESGQPPTPDRFVGMAKRGEGFPRFNVTDKDGNFRITHLSPGDYNLVVVRRFANQGIGELASSVQNFAPERFVEATIEEGKETVIDVDLMGLDADLPKAKLRGRVLVNGLPGADMALGYSVDVDWSAMQNDANGSGARSSRADRMATMKNTITDATGYFDFGDVVAGKGRVEVKQPGKKSAFNFGRLNRIPVVLAENENKDIVIKLDLGRMRGRVISDRSGEPIAMAELRLRSVPPPKKDGESGSDAFMSEWNADVRMETVSDKEGWFDFQSVPEGKYELTADRNGYAPRKVKDIDVPANGEPPAVDVRLMTGVMVKGKVTLPPSNEEEEERRYAWVSFQGVDDAAGNGGARVDTKSMEFHVDGLMPGKYHVSCWASGQGQLKSIEIDVPSQGLEGVTLAFEVEPPEPPRVPDTSKSQNGR